MAMVVAVVFPAVKKSCWSSTVTAIADMELIIKGPLTVDTLITTSLVNKAVVANTVRVKVGIMVVVVDIKKGTVSSL